MSSTLENISDLPGKAWSTMVALVASGARDPGLELAKNFFGRRSILMYLLAFLPLFSTNRAGSFYAAGAGMDRLQLIQRHLLSALQRINFANSGLLRLRLNIHEPVSG